MQSSLVLYVLRSVSIHLTVGCGCVVFSLDAHNLKHSKEHKDDNIAVVCNGILQLVITGDRLVTANAILNHVRAAL